MDDGRSDQTNTGARRQFLKYVAAGAVGGTAAVGLDQILEGGDNLVNGPPTRPQGGPGRYDVIVSEQNGGYEAIDPAGGTIDSESDGWAVLESAITAVPPGGSIYVSGRYVGSSTIVIRKPIQMYGEKAFIDNRQAGDFVFRFEGEERHQTTLAEPATTGDNVVTLDDTSGMQQGDLVLLEEEDGEPVLGRGIPPSEPQSVLGVDGNVVRLEDSIVWRGEYPPGTLVYVIDPIEVHVSGFDFRSPAKDENFYGLVALQCRDSTFENLWLDKFGSRGILLEACANVRVRDCTVLQSSDIEAADGYGIQVWAGCHDILVEGCTAKECRHPLSVTPGGERKVSSRSITFRDCFVTANGAGALNCHGGSAHDVRFEGCTVHTWGEPGLITGAQRTNVSGCVFRLSEHNAIDTRGDGQERIVTVTDTDIYGATNAVKLSQEEDQNFAPLFKLVHLEGVRAYGCNRFFTLGSGTIDRVRNLSIRGCHWDEVGEEGVYLTNRLDGGIITGNVFGQAPNGAHILAGDDPTTQVRNLHIVGNRFERSRGNSAFVQLARSEHCVVSNNAFISGHDVNIYVGDTNSTSNVIKDNSYFAPTPSADPVAENPGSIDRNNAVYDTAADREL